jgi:uncharacterized membrane protein
LNANTGTGLTYQWKRNGSNVPGANATTYSAITAGTYTCVVTNSCGGTTSNSIVVQVTAAPSATINAGGPTTFCTGWICHPKCQIPAQDLPINGRSLDFHQSGDRINI